MNTNTNNMMRMDSVMGDSVWWREAPIDDLTRPLAEMRDLYKAHGLDIEPLLERGISNKARALMAFLAIENGHGAAIDPTAEDFQLELLQVEQVFWRIYLENDPEVLREMNAADPSWYLSHGADGFVVDRSSLDD